MIIDILSRENNEMENGDIDKQIILDFESYIQERKDYQENHLDKKVKGVSHHYEEWAKENQDRIRYAERIVELAKMSGKIPIGYDVDKVVKKIEERRKLLQVANIPKPAKTAANNAFLMAIEDIKSGGIG